MGLFRKKRTIDFTKLPDSRVAESREFKFTNEGLVDLRDSEPLKKSASPVSSLPSNSGFNFLENNSGFSSDSGSAGSSDSETNKILTNTARRVEENSNELYRLLQRIELLERKIERLENGR
ncbi:MAG: hypothetical protein WC533_02155 [Candidatus Pacearchaeota archaeon]